MTAPNDIKKPEVHPFATFLESVPPVADRIVSGLFRRDINGFQCVDKPNIQLHCPTKTCSGIRIFRCVRSNRYKHAAEQADVFLAYRCRNCGESSKTYALRVDLASEGVDESGLVVKFGEIPAFGPPLPSRLISMIGVNRELFLKGWSAERQSLGIGSFSYYRRVVENQKDHILDEVRKAAKRLGADAELLSSIAQAKKETQFSKAIDLVKDAIPDGLKVKGHNPLKMLHSALSKGMHNLSDEECLEQAQAVRVILTELVSNIARVLRKRREVDTAIEKLLP